MGWIFLAVKSLDCSPDLRNESQLCIAADMYFRLREERVAERASNTVFLPIDYECSSSMSVLPA